MSTSPAATVSTVAVKAPAAAAQPEWEPDFVIVNGISEEEADAFDDKPESADDGLHDVQDLEAQMEALAIEESDPAAPDSDAFDSTIEAARVVSSLEYLETDVDDILEFLGSDDQQGVNRVFESLGGLCQTEDTTTESFHGETRHLAETISSLTEQIDTLSRYFGAMKGELSAIHQLLDVVIDQVTAPEGLHDKMATERDGYT